MALGERARADLAQPNRHHGARRRGGRRDEADVECACRAMTASLKEWQQEPLTHDFLASLKVTVARRHGKADAEERAGAAAAASK